MNHNLLKSLTRTILHGLPNFDAIALDLGDNLLDKYRKKCQNKLCLEYNFDYSKAVRGKYYKRLMEEGSNVVIYEPDVAKAFLDSAPVNEALRST